MLGSTLEKAAKAAPKQPPLKVIYRLVNFSMNHHKSSILKLHS
jgi:hypothetical protein